jgi:hypothetical protein
MRDRASFTGAPEPVIYKPAPASAAAVELKRAKRQAWFKALCNEARERADAWIVTSCGADRTILESLPTSGFPDVLRQRGYPLGDEPDGERILPHAVSTPMVLSSNGAMVPATEGSTKPVTMTHYGAGPVRTVRFSFKTPF